MSTITNQVNVVPGQPTPDPSAPAKKEKPKDALTKAIDDPDHEVTFADLVAGNQDREARRRKGSGLDEKIEAPTEKDLATPEDRATKVFQIAQNNSELRAEVKAMEHGLEVAKRAFREYNEETTRKLVAAEAEIDVLKEDNEALRKECAKLSKGVAPSS